MPTSSTPATPRRRRFRARYGIGGLALGAALVVAAPLAASAHIGVTPADPPAGASTRLDFTFSHGCDDSPTTALVFDIPEGVDGVTPVLDGAWTVSRELGSDGIPTEVTYTAVQPVDSGISATVALDVIFASSVAETDVAFPVEQQCVVGSNDWSQIAEDGADPHDLESPAPVVAVGAVAAADSDAHDHADSTDDAAEATDEHTAVTSDPVALWLSGGALVVALGALAVTLLRRRA